MKILLLMLLIFNQAFSDEYSLESVYLAGERGQFYQQFYEQDPKLKSLLIKDIQLAKTIIMFNPNLDEAIKTVRIAKTDSKILFLFYNKIPQEFKNLPATLLTIRTRWIEEIIDNPKKSSALDNQGYFGKTRLTVQLEAWKEFTEPYIFRAAGYVKDVSQQMGLKK